LFCVVRPPAQAPARVDSFVNPLDVSLADPGVLKAGGTYYVYGTGLGCWYSANMIDWRTANVFGIYTHPPGDDRYNFWAPEVIRRPSDGKFLLFYTAQAPGAKLKIYAAQSNSPTANFTEVRTDATGAAVPFFDTVAEDAWIDASPFIDTDGQAYLYVTKDVSSSAGQSGRGAIFVVPVDLDTMTASTPVKVLDADTTGWEVRPNGQVDIEGPYMLKHDGQYFLFYSGNGYWAETYAIGYAVSTSPTGGFVKSPRNPIVTSGLGLYGTGHCSVTTSPDGSEYFLFYHSKIKASSGAQRQLTIDRINFLGTPGNETIQIRGIETTTTTMASWYPQLLPSGMAEEEFCRPHDPFSTLDLGQWHFMDENVWNRSVSGGTLNIKAGSSDVVEQGDSNTRISNLALAYAAPDDDWQVTAKLNEWAPTLNNQRAFVTIWRDQQNFARLMDIYSGGRKLRVLKEELVSGNTVTSSYDLPNTLPDSEKYLRIRKNGDHMSFFVSADGVAYAELGAGYDVNWAADRQLQLGVGAVCPSGQSLTAKFDDVWHDRLSAQQSEWIDEFNDNSLDRKTWVVHNEDQTSYGEEAGAYLRIRTQDGDWTKGLNDLRNVFLYAVPDGDWVATTRVQVPTLDSNSEEAFLVVALDHDHFIKFGRAYDNGRKIEVGLETDRIWSASAIADPWAATDFVQLRITKSGEIYRCEASADGANWTFVGDRIASWLPRFAGLGAASPGSSHAHDCYFDWFGLRGSAPAALVTGWSTF